MTTLNEPNWALASKQPTLLQRARIIQAIRSFFGSAHFLEVETPHRLPGNAPEVHIDAEPSGNWFLQTSPELCMKRLLAAGYPRLFQLCRCWRQEERGQQHLPEFTLLEWYRNDADYTVLMDDCQALITALAPDLKLQWKGVEVNLEGAWEKLTVEDAFRRYADCSALEALRQGQFEVLLTEQVEPQLGIQRPTFLYDYPVELGALARCKPGHPQLAERFELYIAGLELANGFSELTDPVEQEQRFNKDEQQRRETGKSPYPAPTRFLQELSSLNAAAGIALGVDRLVMVLTGEEDIAKVVAFTPEEL